MRWLLLLCVLVSGVAVAQDEAPSDNALPTFEAMTEAPYGQPPAPELVDDLARDISSTLRCPVCQGMSVADSTSPAAVAFQNRIRDMVAQGYTRGQIEDYFISRYGEFILLEPPPEGLNLLLWVLPLLMAGLGIGWAMATVVRWRSEPDEVPLDSDLGLIEKDPYEARLLAELEES